MNFLIYDIYILLIVIALLALPYHLLFRLFKPISISSHKGGHFTPLSFRLATILYYILIINLQFGCGGDGSFDQDQWALKNAAGKVTITAPDTLVIFKEDSVIIRIARFSLNDSIFFERINNSHRRIFITNSMRLSTVMRVSLKESTEEKKLEIVRLNNNEKQVIDTNKYSEWAFSIRAIDYGKITLVVSISALVKTDFGDDEIDCPVHKQELHIVASGSDKFRLFWNRYYWLAILIIMCLFLLLYKLIPNQTIIEYYMPNSNKTNFWNAGALGLVVYLITIASIVVFKIVSISMIYVPLVFIGTVLIYAVFTAVSLRDNDKLSEENFLKLMTLAIKKLPPLNLIFRDNKQGEKV
jgi:hypothetical protein